MIRVDCIGQTRSFYETIVLLSQLGNHEGSFLWTGKDEEHFDFRSKELESLACKLGAELIHSVDILKFAHRV